MDIYTVISRSRNSAEAEPVILRETETTRLVLKPWLVNNAQNPSATIKGVFVFQRKRKGEGWEDNATVPLSKLKSGEAYKLELKANELHELLSHAAGLYRSYRKLGLPTGKIHFIKLRADQDDVRDLQELDIARWIEIARRAGVDGVSGLLEWLSGLDNATEIIGHLARLDVNSLGQINSLVGVTMIRNAMKLWQDNKLNSSEDFWQSQLQRHAFVLSQLFAYPVILFKGKAYVGGKGFNNTGGHIADFLMSNQLTRNAILVEIKTPVSKLLGKEYRSGGVYAVSSELSGAISQVLTNRQSLIQEINNLKAGSVERLEAFCPRCMIVIGHAGNELQSPDRARSFELFRGAFNSDVSTVTFDELFAKAKALLDLMEGVRTGEEPGCPREDSASSNAELERKR
ncbi:MAG: Shedu immune nuclease family protein [Gammaproteobacteria bacterium]